MQGASIYTASCLTLTEPQKTKGIATETCVAQEGEEGPGEYRGAGSMEDSLCWKAGGDGALS